VTKRLFFTLVWLLGCGDDDGTGGGGDAGDPSTVAATCARGCTRAEAANCPSQPTDCQQRCVAEIGRTPPACLSAVDAYTRCATTAVFSCDTSGVAQAASCQPQLATWLACAGGGARDAAVDAAIADASTADTGVPGAVDTGVPDAGETDAGPVGLSCTPLASDGTCDLCLKADCCETLSACGAECADLLACSNACATDDCASQCTARYPGGVAGVQTIYACLSTVCAVDCEDI
jgi:hypothetical protein